MSLEAEREPQPTAGGAGDPAGKAWLAALRRGDREAFGTIVRHTQERLAGHLLGALRLPREQALELTEQTVLDALEIAGQSTSIESPLARLFGTARARLTDRLHATFGDIPGLDVAFDPEPGDGLLRAFYAGDRGVDRQLIHRRNLPPFLELMHEAVQSLPDRLRATIRGDGAPPEADDAGPDRPDLDDGDLDGGGHGEADPEPGATATIAVPAEAAAAAAGGAPTDEVAHERARARAVLYDLAGALLLTHADPGSCPVLGEHLSRAGWQPGHPFDDQLRQRVMYHLGGCPACLAGHQQAVRRIGTLTPLVLWVALRLDEQRRDIMDAIFTPGSPAPDDPAAAGPAHPGAGPGGPPTAAAAATGLGATRVAPGRRQRPRRRAVAAAIALTLAMLGVGLGSWRWQVARPDSPSRLDAAAPDPTQRPTGGDTTPTAGPTTGGRTSTPPATPTATATPTTTQPASSPSQTPSATASSSASGDPVRQAGPTPSAGPTVPGTSAPPTQRLVIGLTSLSTGAVRVSIGDQVAGTCSSPATPCSFAVPRGDPVTIDPVDVVLSWGSGPCQNTSSTSNCVFTATSDSQLAPWVVRL